MRREGKIGEKHTSRTRQTGKCKLPRCPNCHTAPINKSMGKAKGELRLKQTDINSNYLMHDWRVCAIPKSSAKYQNGPKARVGSPSSVWTKDFKFYEDSLDASVTPDFDDDIGTEQNDATAWRGATPVSIPAIFISSRRTRRRALKSKSSVGGIVLGLEEALKPAADGELSTRVKRVPGLEALPETLCFGTIRAFGNYEQNKSSHPDATLTEEWQNNVEGVSDVLVHETCNNAVSEEVAIADLRLGSFDVDGDESEDDFFTAAQNEIDVAGEAQKFFTAPSARSAMNALGAVVASINRSIGQARKKAIGSGGIACYDGVYLVSQGTDSPELLDAENLEGDLNFLESESDESWSGIDFVNHDGNASSSSEDWYFMDAKADAFGVEEVTVRAVSS